MMTILFVDLIDIELKFTFINYMYIYLQLGECVILFYSCRETVSSTLTTRTEKDEQITLVSKID